MQFFAGSDPLAASFMARVCTILKRRRQLVLNV